MYSPYELIRKKRLGRELSPEEIRFLIRGFVAGDVADYQMSAWAMAVCIQGMTGQELAVLTDAMARSGEMVDLSHLPGIPVDKHSTGGVGDKASLVVVPLVAACGIPVAKMSGRGLGHTGGTLDKLESIPGLRVEMSREEIVRQVGEIGLVIASQTNDLVPADRKLYALRDVTATVDSVPLIAASIMSKKIAGGAKALVLDVKVGGGAFMADVSEGRELARAMVEIGLRAGLKTRAVLSSMEQPLGKAVGNALEVREAIETLQGEGPDDLRELCLNLGGTMCYLGEVVGTIEEGIALCHHNLEQGSALANFANLIQAQGGDATICEDPSALPQAGIRLEARAPSAGWVKSIDGRLVGDVSVGLGAGRAKKGDVINPAAGIMLQVKMGDRLEKGKPWAIIHTDSLERAQEAVVRLEDALVVSSDKVTKPTLILGTVGPGEVKDL
ncbi:MAG: Pyrimidine-nucleoside phosphorylase [Chloroflexi bacterium]|nr:Pyrimidine-nucleoside phosphorylase [Chloroflexota bacterium]